jgi:hypothetical protein
MHPPLGWLSGGWSGIVVNLRHSLRTGTCITFEEEAMEIIGVILAGIIIAIAVAVVLVMIASAVTAGSRRRTL